MNADPAADPPTFDYDPGYPQTYEHDFDNAYDRVTVRDIADLLHHAAEMRCSARDGINNVIDVRHEVARSEWTRRKEGRRLVVSAA